MQTKDVIRPEVSSAAGQQVSAAESRVMAGPPMVDAEESSNDGDVWDDAWDDEDQWGDMEVTYRWDYPGIFHLLTCKYSMSFCSS